MAPIIGKRNALVRLVSTPPFATTSANSPPDEDNPNAAFMDVVELNPWDFDEINTVRNLAAIETITKIEAGIININNNDISISAPTDTKNNAPNISLIGVAKILVTAWTFDSAIRTPAKKAPVATDIPIW